MPFFYIDEKDGNTETGKWILLLLILIIILLGALYVPIRVEYRVYYAEALIEHLVVIRYLCFSHRINLLARDSAGALKRAVSRSGRMRSMRSLRDFAGLLYRLLQRVAFAKTRLHITLGCGDAFHTAMLWGQIQAVLYGLIAVLPVKHKEGILRGISIDPRFHQNCLECSFCCIAKTTLANIISAIRHILIRPKKRS